MPFYMYASADGEITFDFGDFATMSDALAAMSDALTDAYIGGETLRIVRRDAVIGDITIFVAGEPAAVR
jgi:hypothetical protein